jgi:histidine ammonia-lyase
VREVVPPVTEDRSLSADINVMAKRVRKGNFV